jgi:GSH-dependent disulfide-bond oxidoreductase
VRADLALDMVGVELAPAIDLEHFDSDEFPDGAFRWMQASMSSQAGARGLVSLHFSPRLDAPTPQPKVLMSDLSAFPITKRWPAKNPELLQLYSLPTPNGVKVSIMLEEIGLPYEVHLVDFGRNDQKTPEFLSLNPNGKIPAILDPDGPGGKPLPLFESGAILQYLAEKTGKLLPQDAARRYQTIQWLHFQMGGIGPMFGQVGFFHKFAGKEYEDKRPLERYVDESRRLLGVMEAHLAGRQWVMDDEYTIADISMLGWVRNLIGFYGAGELVEFSQFKAVATWLERGLARPAVQRGLNIPKRP